MYSGRGMENAVIGYHPFSVDVVGGGHGSLEPDHPRLCPPRDCRWPQRAHPAEGGCRVDLGGSSGPTRNGIGAETRDRVVGGLAGDAAAEGHPG